MVSLLPNALSAMFLAAILGSGVARGADWPQWRGPDRNGHAPPSVSAPASLPAEPARVWRVKVGDGLASPVVAEGRVFHLDQVGDRETLHAVEAGTGAEIWSAPVDDTFKDSQSAAGPRCTPLADGDRVYAQSCRGELQCRDVKDGRQRWRTSYVTNFGAVFIGEKGQAAGATRHGYNGSPVIEGDHLITVAGGTNGASVVCLDKRTGALVWKSQSDTAAYAPPIVAELSGQRQVIAFTVESLMGLDVRTGALLWRVPFKTTFGRHVTTPVIAGDVVAISSHQFGLVGTRVGRVGSGWRATPAWTNREAAINFASPVVVDGHLYGVGPAKNLVCVEMRTGRLAWSQTGAITSSADKAHAAFVAVGGRLLVLTDAGQLLLVAADPSGYRAFGQTQLCGFNWCNPAFADGRLYVRDGKELICVGVGP